MKGGPAMRRIFWLLLLSPGSIATVGCTNESASAPVPTKAPSVKVSVPVSQEVTEYEEFTGMTQAIKTVEIRAHVSGYLTKAEFKEGAIVKEGQLLFEIDTRPFEAELAQAEALLVQAEAKAERTTLDLLRDEKLVDRRVVSQGD